MLCYSFVPLLIFTSFSVSLESLTEKSSLNGIVDIDLPSEGANGTVAVRIYTPSHPRYSDGSPVIIYVPGADTPGGLRNFLPPKVTTCLLYTSFFREESIMKQVGVLMESMTIEA